MKKIATVFLAASSAALFSASAYAADVAVPRAPVRAAPAQQASNWTGGQLGSSNGASSVNNNFVEPGSFNCFSLGLFTCRETPFAFDDPRAGFITGVYLGYRWQMGVWVVGVEGDINYKFNGETSKYQNSPPPWLAFEEFYGSAKQTWDGSARGRLGYLVSPTTLFYITGGAAIGEVKGNYSYLACDFIPGCVYGTGSFSDTRVGWTVGGGVEAVIAYGWKARVEYRYTDLGDFSANIPLYNNYGAGVCGTSCGTNARIDLGPTNQRITFGIGFDF